jgi:preprotein translocase subunit SecF
MSEPPAPDPPPPRHTLSDLYHERTHFQFVERSWRWALLSGAAVLVALVALVIGGLNLGIDFEGGTQWQFSGAGRSSVSVDDLRGILDQNGFTDAKVLILGKDGARIQTEDASRAQQEKVAKALASYADVDIQAVSVTNVGPTWGNKVSHKALTALIVFFFVIAGYLSFRFEWKMAAAALLAVLHDILITVGVYAVGRFEVTPATVVAFLTILGFSLYDTVVVFDKVRENAARLGSVRGESYGAMVNRSLNQVLMRSINTSIMALLPVVSLLVVGTWVLGGLAIRDFALALFIGLVTGAYSSIFVATPALAWLKEREPRYRSLRERVQLDATRSARVPVTVTGPAAVSFEEPGAVDGPIDEAIDQQGAEATAGPSAPSRPVARPRTGASNPPRGRQQRGRKRH